MKTLLTALILLVVCGAATAQTTYVSLTTTGSTNANFIPPPGSTIIYTGYPAGGSPTIQGVCAGHTFQLTLNQTYAGLTNILLPGPGVNQFSYASLEVTCPVSNSVSNYIPEKCIVIPANATGNVNIALQSSTDLINWYTVDPGLYGPNSTNRFFRVFGQQQ